MAGFFHVPIRRQQILLFVVDLGLLLLSLMLAFVIARFAHFNILFVLDRFTVACIIYFTVYCTVFFVGQLYDVENRYQEMRSFLYICGLIVVANLIISMTYYFLPTWRIARRVMAFQAPIAVLFIYLWRRLYALVTRGLMSARRVLLVGADETVASLIEDFRTGYTPEFTIRGIVDDDPDKHGRGFGGVPVLGTSSSLREIVDREKVEIIVFSPGYRLSANGHTVRNVLEMKARGVKVYELATFYMRMTGKVPVRYIEDQWLLFSQDFAGIARSERTSLKRLMDIVVAASALALLSPLMLLLAAIVKLTSRGPVLYRQERVGLDKRPYRLLKFRTMRLDAESGGAPRWASPNDERVTATGRIMRRLRLDEIPQFFNVLRGEMSVIGPRPERPYFVDLLEKDIPYYALRFAAKPGLTGWAQVNYQYGASVEDAHTKLQYDLYYIQQMSPFLDLVILLKTFQTLLFRPGY
ncbi:MAG TPA: sugar transferase [Candidatus Polarisedimenticolia bacterium]|jgi:exopolysaccharide biosynthesis polyprenyl glycosylphosphotransferase